MSDLATIQSLDRVGSLTDWSRQALPIPESSADTTLLPIPESSGDTTLSPIQEGQKKDGVPLTVEGGGSGESPC